LTSANFSYFIELFFVNKLLSTEITHGMPLIKSSKAYIPALFSVYVKILGLMSFLSAIEAADAIT
jgi:hypothetical protein